MTEVTYFDTAACEDQLQEGGFPPEQAKTLRVTLNWMIQSVRKPLVTEAEMRAVEREINARTDRLISELTWRFLGGVSLIVGIAVAFIKLTP